MGITVDVRDVHADLPTDDVAGVLLQYPDADGRVRDPRPVIDAVHEAGALAVVASDLLALTVLESPGQLGADVVLGSTQRFGVPLFYGGPHAGFMAVSAGLERHLPGRLVGVSVDAEGRPAYRLALQTREQHIRRDKATSNICTAQVLLAVTASMYAVYHGPTGLTRIATRTHRYAAVLAAALRQHGHQVRHDQFFDTVTVDVPGRADEIRSRATELGLHVRADGADLVRLALSEVTTREHLGLVLAAFGADAETVTGTASTRRPTTPSRSGCAARRRTSPTRSSTTTAPRRSCCATSSGSPIATTPSTAA